ncbi:hypothetical protein [Anaeromyxobacter oryzisoli]|uniref:hypothetical protein n=1 Tax=Anaeromyxobacter oryzisoli TaxID=2925408 RepID=UPI001F579930|nr:hypothetical protein [Anaeromyxobacter sp. SG63]
MPASDSIYSYNLIGAEYGLRSRLGWREWVTGLDGEPRSILPFTGSTKDGASNRMFACTQTGIWDVSSSTGAPTKVVTFPTQNADSGYGVCTAFTDLNGSHWLLYTDEANGYYTYSEQGTTWTKVTQGTGASQVSVGDPTKFASVVSWKNRLWFVERDTQHAWYLPVGSLYGAASKFVFGSRFKAGGDLRGLWSWTYDGGSGIDDALVAVSGGGDVLIYKGWDPSQASGFALSGVWSVGAVPAGRRLCTDFGGDLLVMSSMGILPLSKLTSGSVLYERTQYQTAKIANLWNQLQASTFSLRGWAMRLHPLDAALMVVMPVAAGQPSQQLVMSLTTKGWHQYRDMPMSIAAEPWNGTFYFGTADGRICANDGYVDGVTLANPNSYAPINWSLLSAFTNMGSAAQKRIHAIRATILSQGGAIPYQAQAKFRWDRSEGAPPQVALAGGAAGAVWDIAKWDQAVWGGDYQAQQQVFGAAGCAPEIAIAIRGAASSRMTLTGIDVAYETGGIL